MRLADTARPMNEERIVARPRRADDRIRGPHGHLVAPANFEAGARERRRRTGRRRRHAQRALEHLLRLLEASRISERRMNRHRRVGAGGLAFELAQACDASLEFAEEGFHAVRRRALLKRALEARGAIAFAGPIADRFRDALP